MVAAALRPWLIAAAPPSFGRRNLLTCLASDVREVGAVLDLHLGGRNFVFANWAGELIEFHLFRFAHRMRDSISPNFIIFDIYEPLMHHPLGREFVGLYLEGSLSILLFVLFCANTALHRLDRVHDFLGVTLADAWKALYGSMFVCNPCSSQVVASPIARLELPLIAFIEAKGFKLRTTFLKWAISF